jgi:hypothetical protein
MYEQLAGRTGHEALAWARNQHYHPSRNWHRLCQAFVRSCFDAPSYYGSAIASWYGADHRHTSWPPPPAVPVWWAGGQYGHVAISAGDGYCWSTDIFRSGQVDKCLISTISRSWGRRYIGWGEDINERRVYTAEPVIDISQTIYAARHQKAALNGRLIKKAVAAEVGRGEMNLGSAVLGSSFRNRYRLLQRKWYGSGDGIPGPTSLTRLARAHGMNPQE